MRLVGHRRWSIASKIDHDEVIMHIEQQQLSTFRLLFFFLQILANFSQFQRSRMTNKFSALSIALPYDIRIGKRMAHCNVPIFESLSHNWQLIEFALRS